MPKKAYHSFIPSQLLDSTPATPQSAAVIAVRAIALSVPIGDNLSACLNLSPYVWRSHGSK
ncbi:MAG TPA: hypothetical protein V6D14_28060 [Coleofasciculaceae cyanobacterium]